MTEFLAWSFVALAAANGIVLGAWFAAGGFLHIVTAYAGRPSQLTGVAAVGLHVVCLGLFAWNRRIEWYPFTWVHAGIVVACGLLSIQVSKILYSRSHRLLEVRLLGMDEVTADHGWDLSTDESASALADVNALHFDEGDYDVLARSHWEMPAVDEDSPQPAPDYDSACARAISTLAIDIETACRRKRPTLGKRLLDLGRYTTSLVFNVFKDCSAP